MTASSVNYLFEPGILNTTKFQRRLSRCFERKNSRISIGRISTDWCARRTRLFLIKPLASLDFETKVFEKENVKIDGHEEASGQAWKLRDYLAEGIFDIVVKWGNLSMLRQLIYGVCVVGDQVIKPLQWRNLSMLWLLICVVPIVGYQVKKALLSKDLEKLLEQLNYATRMLLESTVAACGIIFTISVTFFFIYLMIQITKSGLL